MTAFEELGVLPELGRVLDELGWKLPRAIQHEAIPLILGGGDVLMAAETRSGKTGALCLSIVQLVWEALKGIQEGDIRIGLGARSWTLSNTDRGKGLAVSADGLTCQARELKKWHGCRVTTGVWGDGKYYYEATVVDEGLCRVGWSTEKASLELGTDEFGYGYGGMGQKSHRKQFRTYGGKYGQSDVIGCLLDLDSSQISFTKNGKNLGVAFEINETDKGHTNFYPAVFVKNAEMAFNFGETEFKFPVPEGYVPVFDAPPGKVTLNPNTVCESTFQLPKPPNNAPQAVIVAPTRESAEQMFNQIQMFQKYLKDPEVRALLLIGGVDLDEQLKVLQRGVDIVVATVGRLDDLIANGTIMLSSCRVFVLDDVDALLRCGYMEVIERMHKKIPKITTDSQRLQMVICSGTLDSEEVRKLPERLMHFPTWVDLKEADVVPETVHHVVYMIDPYKDQSWHHWLPTTIQTDKVHALDDVGPGTNTPEALSEAVKRLKGEYALNAIKLYEIDRAIIYCRTKLDCDNMERFLRQALGTKYSFACLHRDRNSRERKVNVAKFRNEQLDFLISTDVATRGIDVSEFGVMPEIGKAIDEMEWMLPTDVQAEAIPLILGGGDVLMAAETGSGKTGAFCLPILQIVWETLRDIREGKAGKAVGNAGKPWTLSFTDRGHAMAVTPDGLRCQSREFKEWHGCRATTGVRGKGKYYYEATVTDEGLCRVGWSTEQANLDLGTDRFGFGFGGTGKKSNSKQFDSYGEAFGKMDVIGCMLDLDRGEVSFTKNGVSLGLAFKINDAKLRESGFFPAVVLKNAEMSFNFGETDFKYPIPDGYVAVCKVPHDYLALNSNTGSESAAVDSKPKPNAPQAIVIEPSRELAEQTFNQIQKFKKYLKDPEVRELLLIGGVNIKDQMEVLQRGVDIIVGTPGRLEDLIGNGYVLLSGCRFFVLDEADGLLKQGYTELIERLHKQIPKITADGRRLQMVVCSATLHSFEVKKLAEKLMHFPTWVDLKGEDAVPETVHHVVCMVDPQKDNSWQSLRSHIQTDGVHARDNVRPGSNTAETLSEAIKMLKGEYTLNAINEHNMDRAIIFCRTKLDCDNLERYLRQVGGNKYSCVCLHGDRKPQERKANLEKFKNKQVKFLICTDVAARGLDVTGLPFIINVTLPDEKSNYVHRIGRVGRAERMGLAISLVSTVPEKVWYHGQWCASRGKNCWNTNLTDVKGCCMWYDEKMYLAEIEDHLNVTIQQIDKNLKVPMNDFDGKVVYGEKRLNTGTGYKDHVEQLTPVVKELAKLEREAQNLFLKRMMVQ